MWQLFMNVFHGVFRAVRLDTANIQQIFQENVNLRQFAAFQYVAVAQARNTQQQRAIWQYPAKQRTIKIVGAEYLRLQHRHGFL